MGRTTYMLLCVFAMMASPRLPAQTAGARPAGGEERAAHAARVESALVVFRDLSASQREQVLTAVRTAAAAVADPLLAGLARFAAQASERGTPRVPLPRGGGRASETGAQHARGMLDGLPFPPTVGYRFGAGTVEVRELADGPPARRHAAAQEATLAALLDGHPVDWDRALAGLLRALDADRRVDEFAALLEGWRNGAESFYEALERTGGTGQGVFHYDAMFDEWLQRCVGRRHPDRQRLVRSQDDACRAFQSSFRNYRRYRGLREALALTLVLPADAPFPENLRAFDQSNGGYSMRQSMALLLAAHGGDPAATVSAFLAAAPALPETLWAADHPAYEAFQQLFQDHLPRMLERASHTDELLARWQRERNALRTRLAEGAMRAFTEALPGRARTRLADLLAR